MKNGTINLVDLDYEYKLWKKRLSLFIDEITLINERNEEVKNEPLLTELNSVELMVLEEHKEELEKYLNRIITQEEELQFYNKDFPITADHKYFTEHVQLRSKMEKLSQDHLERVADLIKALGI